MPTVSFKRFGAGVTATYDTSKGWSGVGFLRLGTKELLSNSQLTVHPKGVVTAKSGLQISEPFGLQGLRVTASSTVRLDQPGLMGTTFGASMPILGKDPAKTHSPAPSTALYLLLPIEGEQQTASDKQPEKVQGVIRLEARF